MTRALLAVGGLVCVSGCGGDGTCSYSAAVTGNVTVTAVSTPANPPSGCTNAREVAYRWTTGGASRFPNFDAFYANGDCLTAASIAVGSTFMVTRQDLTSGACVPSTRTIGSTAVNACICGQ
jgi:hypothetical protein